ncbi:MAG: DUF2791 family P-loop domain-containing protein, partial [Acidimicrobiales bacterium]|nr:DUF2791 family P-loop domain-containing protein [Acidimicrobiales bacterium]
IRLTGFTPDSLLELGCRVRDIFGAGAKDPARLRAVVDDAYVRDLAAAVGGELGGRTGVSPRLFLKKLVADVLDRVDLHADFDPRRDYSLTVADNELTEIERNARAATSVDEINLALEP